MEKDDEQNLFWLSDEQWARIVPDAPCGRCNAPKDDAPLRMLAGLKLKPTKMAGGTKHSGLNAGKPDASSRKV